MFSILERFFANLTGSQRLLMFILVVALTTFLVAFLAGGWATGVPIAILVLVILWLTRPLWKPPSGTTSRTRIALSSLTLISGVALAVLGKAPEGKPLLRALLALLHLGSKSVESAAPPDRLVSALILAFVLIGVFVVNWFARDTSAMRKHTKSLDEDFPEQTYRQQLHRFAVILAERLSTLDNETNWDDYFFAPLEANVEVISGRRSKKEIVDLMRALKEQHGSRILLVLGDPGAGKSIALRKLAKELIGEVERTGRLPVYINLKEWSGLHTWTEQNPPTAMQLREFILRRLKGESAFADGFLGSYFDRMLDRGRFFFLFDSFDEIPGVLDVSEASWLLQHLSRLFTEFFVSQEDGRGIVASRVYRRPKFNRNDSVTVEIRPFSDLQIHEALLRSGKLRNATIQELFRNRTELIPVARNPFSAALLRIYAESHGGGLPSNQLEMYESYILGRFDVSVEEMRKHNFAAQDLVTGATDIAWCMFQAPDIGLEASIPRLAELLPNVPVSAIGSVLRFSGIARVSSEARFSFVHRRLNEYFVTRRLLTEPTKVKLQAIPTDSRYRDALVLYCEVGEKASVAEIATFCWNEILDASRGSERGAPDKDLRAVHCLRFLRDAFRTRSEVIVFASDLARYITERVRPHGDLLAAKLALEATGLLQDSSVEGVLVQAFQIGNFWISETALHACRHLKGLGKELEERLRSYLRSIPIRDFLRRRRELIFSLSLSDAFRPVRRYCVLRSFDNRIYLGALALCCLLSPVIALFGALAYLWDSFRLTSQSLTSLFRFEVSGIASVFVATAIWEHFTDVAHRSAPIFGLVGTVVLMPVEFAPLVAPVLQWVHGWSHVALVALFALIVLAITPFLDLSMILLEFQLRNVWRLLVRIAIVGVAFIVLLYLLPWLGRSPLMREWGYAILLSVPCLGMLYLLTVGVYKLLADRRHFKDAARSTAIARSSIATDFGGFRTHWYRTRYVEWLRDNQVLPTGTWPDKRPNCKDDHASAMLAQLDERWLGLDA